MSEELATLKAIQATMEKLLKWTRIASIQQLRSVLTQNLTTDNEMLIFELSDGERTSREIAKLARVGSNATILSYWRKWSKVGIVEPSPQRKGRFHHICSLEEVGLTVPPVALTIMETPQLDENEEDSDERK